MPLWQIVGDIRASMLEELDFSKEADNIDEFLQFLRDADVTQATAPRVYRKFSTKRVLTMVSLLHVTCAESSVYRRWLMHHVSQIVQEEYLHRSVCA